MTGVTSLCHPKREAVDSHWLWSKLRGWDGGAGDTKRVACVLYVRCMYVSMYPCIGSVPRIRPTQYLITTYGGLVGLAGPNALSCSITLAGIASHWRNPVSDDPAKIG